MHDRGVACCRPRCRLSGADEARLLQSEQLVGFARSLQLLQGALEGVAHVKGG